MALLLRLSALLLFFCILHYFLKPGNQEQMEQKGLRDDTGEIIPLKDFNYKDVSPTKHRPYRNTGYVAMDWLEIDSQYLSRIQHRRFLVTQMPETTIGDRDAAKPAIRELFEQVVLDYLPKRYPTIFKLEKSTFTNWVTGRSCNVNTAAMDEAMMLRTLAENAEEDFFLMVPDANDVYRLQGYVACFPGGFLCPSKAGWSVRELHQAVPGYNEKIGNAVDRYFARMKAGVFIRRWNWSLQTDGVELFKTEGNNFYATPEQKLPAQQDAVDVSATYLRAERQTLFRLPRSRAIVFCVRSFMTPLVELVEEGEGPALADAIQTMPDRLGVYKKRPVWEEDVISFLRSPAA
ncbi:hypothetical protein MKZ38_001668 [Zalerion maritima]|uniref:DUF3445 domain containing protein n=1 Tax=Zalerion maritima TaxID=339359 RepID=A0AAD5RR79_9PEZI|nr:hypothetical protein MKZ38_001668 [Zalerion maritima]